MIAKKSFEVEVQIEKQGNGILVAQGGDAHGWGFSIEDGISKFFVCLGGKVETVTAKENLEQMILRFRKNKFLRYKWNYMQESVRWELENLTVW